MGHSLLTAEDRNKDADRSIESFCLDMACIIFAHIPLTKTSHVTTPSNEARKYTLPYASIAKVRSRLSSHREERC